MTAPTGHTTDQPTSEQAADQQETTPRDGAPAAENAPTQQPGASTLTHEQALVELTRVRGEAANYRTRLREAETRLGTAKTAEEFEAAIAEVKAQNAALEQSIARNQVARKYGLPDDLAARLRGDTTAELDADAKALQRYANPAVPVGLSGGLDPADSDDGFDPVTEARKARAARR